MKILVVEDDRTVGGFVARGLEEQRFNVELGEDGKTGLERASQTRYDVIVLDCRRGAQYAPCSTGARAASAGGSLVVM